MKPQGGVSMRKIIFLTLLFSLTLALSGEKITELKELSRPEMIRIDGDTLVVVQGATTFVYSMKDFRLLAKFGKQGNGPGELNPQPRYKMQVEVVNGEILLNNISKMVYFSKNGNFIREKRFPFIALKVLPIGKNYVITKSVFKESGNLSAAILFDHDLREIKTLYSRGFQHYKKSGKIDMLPRLVLIRKWDDKVFVFDQGGDFIVDVFDESGKHLKKITADVKKFKVSKDFIDRTWAWAEKDVRVRNSSLEMRRMAYFPEYFPVAKNFWVDGGRIYAHTYRMKEDGSVFLVLDFKGKILKKVFLAGADINTIEYAPYAFKDGKYIYLYENPDTEQIELHIEKISEKE